MAILSPARLQQARLFGFVLPLLAFMTVFLFVPVGSLLLRAVQDPEIAQLAPNLQREIRVWDGTGMPPEPVVTAFRDDLAALQRARRAAIVAKRAATIDPAFRDMIMSAARMAAVEPPPSPEDLLQAIPKLREPATWTALRGVLAPFTDSYLLAAIDHSRDPLTGEIRAVPSSEAIFIDTLGRTLGIGLCVTLICLFLAYPLAYVVVRQSRTMQAVMLTFVLLPFWTSILVRSAAWLVLLQTHGVVNDALIAMSFISEPLKLVYSRAGTVLAMVHIQLPFTFLPIYSVMKLIPGDYTRAASSLGARPAYAFCKVYLPLTLPGVAAGCLLTFILCLGYYITPALLGGPSDQMLSYYVAYYLNQNVNWSMAAAVSLVLLFITLAIYVLYVRLVPVLRQTEG